MKTEILAPKSAEIQVPDGYRLAWSDEFDGTKLDATKWDIRTGARNWSYQKAENLSVEGGLLRIALRKEQVDGKAYTGGGIISRQAFRYAYYEARLRMTAGAGWHTSFMLAAHADAQSADQKRGQQIEICEHDSVNVSKYSTNVIDNSNVKPYELGPFFISMPDAMSSFHTYGCEFTPTTINFFFDGEPTGTVNVSRVRHADNNIWISCIASFLGGSKAMDDSKLPSNLYVEFVRVFVPVGT